MANPGPPGSGIPPEEWIRLFLSPDPSRGCLGRLNNWMVLNRLGLGAMGAVFRAVDSSTNETAAVKFCLKDEPRFLREIDLLEKLPPHPAIIGLKAHYKLHDSNSNTMHCFVMEFVGGGTLASRLKSWQRLPLVDALRICRGVAWGLAHLHKYQIRHRDLKPLNILMDDDHEPKLADFGMAVDVLRGNSGVGGTPPYMAPEAFNNPAQVDQRAEYFSLGVTLHELLTGQLPFPTHASLFSDKSSPAGLIFIRSNLGEGVARLVADLCEKNPDNRLTDPAAVELQFTDLLKKALNSKLEVVNAWPRVDPTQVLQLVEFAERAEPLLKGKLTSDLAQFVGKSEILRQLRFHRETVNNLKLRLSLLIKQLGDVEGASGTKRLNLIEKEVERGLAGFDDICYSRSKQPAAAPLTVIPQDQALTRDFAGLLQKLMFETTRIKSDLILNHLDTTISLRLRSELEELWTLSDEYCLQVDDRLRTCTDQFLTIVEILERGR